MDDTKEIIYILKGTLKLLKWDLENEPLDSDTRLAKVLSLDKIGEAINLLDSIN